MVWSKVRKELGLLVVFIALASLVATGLGQDWASALAPVKGKKCTVYLKSGEVRKGKLKKIGQDYITVQVKLSPFYAEPQTYQITEVERIEYDKGAIDVEELLGGGQKSAGSSSVRPTQAKGGTAQSGAQSDDETVQKLMAILKSLDEGSSAKEERKMAAAVEPTASVTAPASELEPRTSARPTQQTKMSGRSNLPRTSPSAKRAERARKVVVPLTRKPVKTRAVSGGAEQSQTSQQVRGANRSRQSVKRPSPTSRTPSSTARRPSVPKTKRKKTIPAPKPPKTRLAQAGAQAAAPARAKRPNSAESSVLESTKKLAAEAGGPAAETKNAASGAVHGTPVLGAETKVPAGDEANGPVLKAVTVLAGAVGFLALAVLVLAVVVLKRHRAAATAVPVAVPSPAASPVAAEPATSQPSTKPPAPIHVVMVKGDYAVVDRGLDQGIKVGELLLLRRSVEDGEYEIGLARVLKVFDRLSGVKLVERWVETDLRVGDTATRYRPAEPTAEDFDAVTVTQVRGRPHPVQRTRQDEQEAPVSLPSQAGISRRSGWSR